MASNFKTMSEKTNRYIDPLSDFGFSYFFGTELNKKILLKFLNAVFEGKKEIADLVFNHFENDNDEDTISNLLCTEKNGQQFTVMLCKVEQKSFRKSSREFISRYFRKLADKHSTFGQPVNQHYMIGLLDFSFGDCEPTYYREISFSKVDKKLEPAGQIGFRFLEIPEFYKPGKELQTDLDKWFYLLKHLHRWSKVPQWIEDEQFKDVFIAAELSGLTPDQRTTYATELKNKRNSFELYHPEEAANDAMRKELEEGNLDIESKEYFLEVFRMGYEEGFDDGMMEITHELGSMFSR